MQRKYVNISDDVCKLKGRFSPGTTNTWLPIPSQLEFSYQLHIEMIQVLKGYANEISKLKEWPELVSSNLSELIRAERLFCMVLSVEEMSAEAQHTQCAWGQPLLQSPSLMEQPWHLTLLPSHSNGGAVGKMSIWKVTLALAKSRILVLRIIWKVLFGVAQWHPRDHWVTEHNQHQYSRARTSPV